MRNFGDNLKLFNSFTRILILTVCLFLTACQSQVTELAIKSQVTPPISPSITVTPIMRKALYTKTPLPQTQSQVRFTDIPESLVQQVQFNFETPLPENIIINVYKMNRPVFAEETGFEQVLGVLKTQTLWPGRPIPPQRDFQANNDALALFGCLLNRDGEDDLNPYSLYCKGKKLIGNIDLVSPVYINRSKNDFLVTVAQAHNGVMIVHHYSIEPVVNLDDWSLPTAQFLGDNEIKAFTKQGPNKKDIISVYENGKILYENQIEFGKQKPLVGLWAYENHWGLEITDNVIIDGQSVNTLYGYKKSFEFHVLGLKPLFFFEKGGKIGLNFDGHEINLDGYIIPHENCCSDSLLNPRQSGDVLIFFMNKDAQWYYFEVEVINK
jgi:starvation-inducible outer membrane lipoprotein